MAESSDPRPKRPGIPLSAVILATVAAALVTALVVSLLTGVNDQEPAAERIQLQDGEPGGGFPSGVDPSGTPAPDFAFEALDVEGVDGGGDVDFAEYRDGRPTVLNFFGSWCAPCVQEMPDLEEASQEFQGDVLFVGLAENDAREDALEIVESTGVTYDVGRDPNGDILSAFEGLAMPTTVFITADGTISNVFSGALTADDLRTKIEEELL